MKTYCVMCIGEIPEKRQRRGSHYCSRECHREYRRLRRQQLAERKCRLCGRGLRKKKQEEAVRSGHTATEEAERA